MDELKPSPVNSTPLTPIAFLERAAIAYADCLSVIYNDTTYTWSQTNRRCLQVASSLSSYGIETGHVVSVLAPNVPATYELQFAVPMAGAILHNINTRLDARNVCILLRHSESKLVFVDYLSRELILEAVSLFPPNTKRPTLVLITDDADPDADQSSSSSLTGHFSCSYEDMVEKGDPGFEWVQPQSEWDPVVLNYTSGTTSSPKGVVQSHRGIFIVSAAALIDWGVPKQPVYLWALPIFHTNGWSHVWGMAAVGGTNICLRKVEAPTIYSLIDRHDRSKDVIISGGENISSVEVESVLYTHPAVHEAAVVGRPDEFWGETPCAFVDLKDGLNHEPCEKDIIDFCRNNMPHFMVPKTVVFKDELPRTSTGKIQKFVLKEIAKGMGPKK
ncbi:hypothetical protein Peur_065573 [Populus x canadensis]